MLDINKKFWFDDVKTQLLALLLLLDSEPGSGFIKVQRLDPSRWQYCNACNYIRRLEKRGIPPMDRLAVWEVSFTPAWGLAERRFAQLPYFVCAEHFPPALIPPGVEPPPRRAGSLSLVEWFVQGCPPPTFIDTELPLPDGTTARFITKDTKDTTD